MKIFKFFSVFLATIIVAGCAGNETAAPLTMHWSLGEKSADNNGTLVETITLTNRSKADMPADWVIWFNHWYRPVVQPERAPVKVEWLNGTLYKMYPTEYYQTLRAGEVLEIPFETTFPPRNNFSIPEGVFIVIGDGKPLPVKTTATGLPLPNDGRHIYERNKDAGEWKLTEGDIIPFPKYFLDSKDTSEGTSEISKQIRITAPEAFAGEARLLGEKLTTYWGAQVSDEGKTVISLVEALSLYENHITPEGYILKIVNGKVTITAETAAGAFYGTQSLVDMLKGHTLPATLSNIEFADQPDLGFRGQHFDISRNYTTKENLFRLIDQFASLKLNVMHFHFSDDEGWRLEIPGLPELTEIGARRGYTTDERDMLVPAYGGGSDPAQGIGSGYLTKADFIELLKYAKERHITVIPEIESPGHARAAKVAMTARYDKYIDTDPAKAREFLLEDFEDASRYFAAGDYLDNVMNIALPSTYRFMEKVIDEIVAMYAEADAPLWVVHIGGDEVPDGAWSASPVAEKFMRENGIADATSLGDYYIIKVNEILKARGLKMAGWQELVVGRSDEFREAVKDNLGYVNCWRTNGRHAYIPYHLANIGYPIVLSNVCNIYFDLAYSGHPDEPGLWWGGYVDEQRAFSMQPFDIYASIRRDDAGYPVDYASAGEGLEQLTPEGRKNILGVQGQLWAETIRSFDNVGYLLFPKIYGLAERAWNASPAWSESQNEPTAFLQDYSRFNTIVTEREMPWLKEVGFNFHISQPGIYIEDGILYANSPIAGAEIRYTTDGSVPTLGSALWTQPVKCDAAEVTARLFYLDHQSVSSTWRR
jgi:hexosaminidase